MWAQVVSTPPHARQLRLPRVRRPLLPDGARPYVRVALTHPQLAQLPPPAAAMSCSSWSFAAGGNAK